LAKGLCVITGTRTGLGRYLAELYLGRGFAVAGCSRGASDLAAPGYHHFRLDVADESQVSALFAELRQAHEALAFLINNAGAASMNHFLLTPFSTVQRIYETNVMGCFLFSREAGKWMSRSGGGRIVNLTTPATRWQLEGEAAYASSKAAVESLTQILARELAPMKVTVNAVAPPLLRTDLTRSVPQDKIDALLERQAIPRFGEPADVANAIDFFLRGESDLVTGQVLFLGGA
jgi:3-oxoacyl-[acyl-carrier protein] reductase